MSGRNINVTLTPELMEEVRAYAAATNRTPANLLLYAVSQHMKRHPLGRTRRGKDESEEEMEHGARDGR